MDKRTKRQKLKEMANQTVSPNEAEIAKQKLAELGPEEVPQPSGIILNMDVDGFTIVFTYYEK